MGVKKLNAIFGFSLGGLIGLEMASTYPLLSHKYVIGAACELPPLIKMFNALQLNMLREASADCLKHSRILQRITCTSNDVLSSHIQRKGFEMAFSYYENDAEEYNYFFTKESFYKLVEALNQFTTPKYFGKHSAKIYLFSLDDDMFTPRDEIKKLVEILSPHFSNVIYEHFPFMKGHESWVLEFHKIKEHIYRCIND